MGRLSVFIVPLALLSLLCVYSLNSAEEFYPPLKEELKNGGSITIYLEPVVEVISGNKYVVMEYDTRVLIFFPAEIDLREGEFISVEGVYREGAIQVESYHLHKHYSLKYPISLLGFFILFYYMRKEWKFHVRTFSFEGK